MYQQLVIQQQYLIRQSLLVQSNPYYQAHAQALAAAQATLRAQLQQNILRQQQLVTTVMAIAGHKIANSAPSSTAVSTSGSAATVTGGGGGNSVPVCHSGATGVQQTHTQQSAKAFTNSETAKTSNYGLSEGGVAAHQRHIQQQQQQQASQSKQQQGRTVSSSKQALKNSGSNGAHSNTATHQTNAGSTDRKTVRLKAK